jgi:LmbE family N-acetylglucosaminyl deacetylase
MTAKLRLQNVPVTVVAASDGENAYASAQGLGKARELEQYEALARLGVDHRSVHRLRLPDRELTAWEGALERGLSAVVSSETHIVAPWPRDFHPDHEACGRAAESVARRYGLKLTFYLFWTWHRGVPGMLDDLSLVSLHLTEEERCKSYLHSKAHLSQFEHPDGAPILSQELLRPAEREFEVYLLS